MTDDLNAAPPTPTPDRAIADARAALALGMAASAFAARALDLVPEATADALAPDLATGACVWFVAVELIGAIPLVRFGYRYLDGGDPVVLHAIGGDGPIMNAATLN